MKIVFLTSSLEPSHDGVGDYTRLLAAECQRQGHQVRLIALNDPQIEKASVPTSWEGECPHEPGGNSWRGRSPSRDQNLLRLSFNQPWSDRVRMARDFIEEFSPDFVSLQFVCYGFHPQGIDWQLPSLLKAIVAQRPVHLMFHELWIGAEKNACLKQRFIGMLQRQIILKILHQLEVRVIHTNNPAYIALLHTHGIKATQLPLFGNIPIHEAQRQPHEGWNFGLFGTLHPIWPPEPLFSHLRETGKKIKISHIGRLGSGQRLWREIKRDYHGVFEFQTLGEQSPETIAGFFSTLDFGIATSPWELIGKSGTVAALLEQGLPVIVNRDEIHYHQWQETGYSPLLIKMGSDFPARLAAAQPGKPHQILPDVTRQFLQDLTA